MGRYSAPALRTGERGQARDFPFGFWYVLDWEEVVIEEGPEGAEGHKRLSAFGMSWTKQAVDRICNLVADVTNAFRLLVCLGPAAETGEVADFLLQLSQTPFGFWYVLDKDRG